MIQPVPSARISSLPALTTHLTALLLIAILPLRSLGQEPVKVTPRLPVYPLDAAVAPDGTVYVVDRNLPGVWQWKAGELTVFFQGSPKYRTPLNAPRCVTVTPEGLVLVGDSATREVYRLPEPNKAEPITGGKIGIPMDLALASDGSLYVADLELRTLYKIPAGQSAPEMIAQVNPRGVFVDDQDRVWVVSQNAEQLIIVSDDGKIQPVVKTRVFDFPHQVYVDDAGVAYVTDGYKKAVWKVSADGKPELLFSGPPLDNPVGLTATEDGQLVVVDPRAQAVFKFAPGEKPTVWFKIEY
ncbi:MAG: lipoprotein [Pirellulaceae bacterium]|nr:MAG: lipoprotein [Pirellulaceae bacterium]